MRGLKSAILRNGFWRGRHIYYKPLEFTITRPEKQYFADSESLVSKYFATLTAGATEMELSVVWRSREQYPVTITMAVFNVFSCEYILTIPVYVGIM